VFRLSPFPLYNLKMKLGILLLLPVFAVAQPVITPGGVVGSGLSSPNQTVLSPGAIFSVFGTGFAPAGTFATSTVVNNALTTVLAHTCVEVNGTMAPLFAVLPTQINAQVPGSVTGAGARVSVVTGCDTGSPVTSAPAYVVIRDASPEFFYFSESPPSSLFPIAAVDTSTNAFVGPGDNSLPFPTQVAAPGDVLLLYATGLGPVSPALAPGTLAPGAASLTVPFTITLGGAKVDPANILYAGAAPTFAGLYQINLRVPASTPAGPQPISIIVDGVASPPSASVYIGPGGCTLPAVQSFNAFPNQLASAGTTQISWATANAASLSIQPAVGSNSLSGSVSQSVSATTSFTLTATNQCGSATASLQVGVVMPIISGLSGGGTALNSLEVGDTVQVALQNTGDLSSIQSVVLTTPDGGAYGYPLQTDGSGNVYFRIPMLPEFTAGSPTAVQVSLLTSAGVRTTPVTQTLNVSVPVYPGDAVGDFAILLNQISSAYSNAVKAQGSFPLGATVGSLNAAFSSLLSPLQAALSQVKAQGSAQIPFLPASASVPNPPMVTVTAQEINVIMALMVKTGGSDSDLSALSRADGDGPLANPRASAGACPQSIRYRAPMLDFCKNIAFPKNVAEVGQLMSTVAAAAFAAFAVAPPVGVVAAGSASALLAVTGALASAICYSQPIWLQQMSFSPSTIPNTFGTPSPQPSLVQLNATLGPNISAILPALAQQVLTVASGGLAEGINSLLLSAPFTAALSTAVANGVDKTGSSLADILAGVIPNLKAPPSNVTYQVGYCADDIISPVDPPGGFPLPYIAEKSGPAGQVSGMNDFYLLGMQPTDGYLTLPVKANPKSFLLPASQSNLPCFGTESQILCETYLAVGPPAFVAISTAFVQADLGGNDGCSSRFGPNAPVTYASPYRLSLNTGIGSASMTGLQTGDATWKITLTSSVLAGVKTVNGQPEGGGCDNTLATVSITGPVGAPGSPWAFVTVNQDSSPAVFPCPDDGISVVSGPAVNVVPGTTYPIVAPATIAQGSSYSAGITASTINLYQSCTVDFTIQLQGPPH
jgi:uncharacterized protein (TIGR03437 family)